VRALAERSGYPILADALSNIRHGDSHDGEVVIGGYHLWLPVVGESLGKPDVILRFGAVPIADASGVGALERFIKRCRRHNVAVVFCELNPRVQATLQQLGVLAHVEVVGAYEEAIAAAAAAAEERAGG